VHLGKQKAAMLRYGDSYLPYDPGGYVHTCGSRHFKRSSVVKAGKRTSTEFARWIAPP
jgi:hypothetical protein